MNQICKTTKVTKRRDQKSSDVTDAPHITSRLSTAEQKKQSRRVKNQISARNSRQRRMTYLLQLELSLKTANELIRSLEAELRSSRAESLVAEGCILTQALFDSNQTDVY